ncbi:MAG: hypothetical protein QGI31_06770 [Dehalococcoidia bacterium]|nr:hypothetical protein [Candidatus Poribacteria bacterium]MDP7674517.1 hypothetical protein [Dehalococcoidia bacterium]
MNYSVNVLYAQSITYLAQSITYLMVTAVHTIRRVVYGYQQLVLKSKPAHHNSYLEESSLGSSVSFTPMNKGGLRGMWYKTAGNPRVKRKSPPYASIWTQKLGADPSRGGQSGMASG